MVIPPDLLELAKKHSIWIPTNAKWVWERSLGAPKNGSPVLPVEEQAGLLRLANCNDV